MSPTRQTVLPLRSKLAALAVAMGLLSAVGCANNGEFMTEQRLNRGMVMILPGIEGVSQLNKDIRHGLVAAGVRYAMPIRTWGNPIPLVGVLVRQVDIIGSHIAAAGIRDEIVTYQDAHPGAPVYIIGHSGGGGIAVLVAEKMPKDRKLQGVVLLSASLSSSHNMTEALKHAENGIVNFYNRDDAALLGVATIVLGNIDGMHGPSAGLIGCDWPKDDHSEQRKLAYTKLYQKELTYDMIAGGDAHTAVTRPGFVATYVSPWVFARQWPATHAEMYAYMPTATEAKTD
ncbi:MAG: alpha/beta fold hydrolase [Planctomycetota bacterium]